MNTVTFVTYAVTGHPLDPAILFASLQMFSLLAYPITFLPSLTASLADAQLAICKFYREACKLICSADRRNASSG